MTSHDALGYYARRYGIEVIGAAIPALTTQAQASAGETAELIDLIRDRGRDDDLPRGRGQPRARGGDRRPRPGPASAASSGPTRSARRAPTAATYIGSLRANTDELVDGFSDGAVSCRLDR